MLEPRIKTSQIESNIYVIIESVVKVIRNVYETSPEQTFLLPEEVVIFEVSSKKTFKIAYFMKMFVATIHYSQVYTYKCIGNTFEIAYRVICTYLTEEFKK